MPKLLITVTPPQDAWLRGEAERLGLPGGVSELVRRAVDEFRFPRLHWMEGRSPVCVECKRPWGGTVRCAGGCSDGPLCETCI